MTIGVLPEQGGSLATLAATGQDRRFIDQYLARYGRAFDRVYYFSYASETARLPPGCSLIANSRRLHRWLYSFAMPVLRARYFRQCDVIRVMQLTGEVPAVIARMVYRIPFAATFGYRYADHARADGAGAIRTCLFRWRTGIVLKLASRIIVTNRDIQREATARAGAEKVVFLPNGVDCRAFSPGPPTTPAPRTTLLFVGRLSPQKRLTLLIDAVALMKCDVTLRFIGDGPLRDQLANYAQRAGVRLELPGIVEHHLLPEEFRRAAVFVMTSKIEGHPKALIEAMSCGAVCVATAAPGVTDMIDSGRTGLICEPNAEAVAATLDRALNDTALRTTLSANARARVEAEFDIEMILAREVAMLRELAQSRSGRC